MRAQSANSTPTVVSIVLTILLFLGAGWVFLNHQRVLDQLSFWQFTPSAQIYSLANSASMNDKAKFYFYASHPELDGTSTFNQECKRQEENTAILGCYSDNRIYVYDIKDERLAGVREVTAAHETLHAIYQRLSGDEKTRVNALLEAEYELLLKSNDTDLKNRMQYYSRTEPGERDNELHSIIGTEVGTISTELEQYYAQYFTDRSQLIKLHDSYKARFSELAQNSSSLKRTLEQLSADITAMTNQYNASIATLNDDIESFNTRAQNSTFSSQAEFNAARQALVSRTDVLKQQRTAINQKTDEYEKKRQAYNQTVDESNSLQRSLDSSLAPAPSL